MSEIKIKKDFDPSELGYNLEQLAFLENLSSDLILNDFDDIRTPVDRYGPVVAQDSITGCLYFFIYNGSWLTVANPKGMLIGSLYNYAVPLDEREFCFALMGELQSVNIEFSSDPVEMHRNLISSRIIPTLTPSVFRSKLANIMRFDVVSQQTIKFNDLSDKQKSYVQFERMFSLDLNREQCKSFIESKFYIEY